MSYVNSRWASINRDQPGRSTPALAATTATRDPAKVSSFWKMIVILAGAGTVLWVMSPGPVGGLTLGGAENEADADPDPSHDPVDHEDPGDGDDEEADGGAGDLEHDPEHERWLEHARLEHARLGHVGQVDHARRSP